MATIQSDETGQLVQAEADDGRTYYYLADSLGTPFHGAWFDPDKAQEAFDAGGDETQFPPVDREIDEAGKLID